MALGEALLTPTRIYVRQILETIRGTDAVKALAHITGGGLTDNIPRVLPDDLAAEIDIGAFALPAVFAWLQVEARLNQEEMLRTFNCGIGMILIVSPGEVERVLKRLGDETRVIGAIAKRGRGHAVRYQGELAWGAR
jgi:phosphoribosylformylglycinamidine cyclo-ligase